MPRSRTREQEIRFGARWAEETVAKLVAAGHNFFEIPDYTLQQVTMMLDAAERREAATRANFVTDMVGVVGAIFGSSKTLEGHLDLLVAARDEEERDGESQ